METGEQGEILNQNEELSPAEHLFFIGSSTYFEGKIVNMDTLDENLKNPDFIDFFLRPIAIGENSSEEVIDKVNRERAKGIKIFAPLFLNSNVSAEDLAEQLANRFYVKIPKFGNNSDSNNHQWRVRVEDKQGSELPKEKVRRLKDYTPASSILAFSYDEEANELVIDLKLPNRNNEI